MCEDNRVTALPLLQKISNRKLYLNNYTLNYGLCESISNAFKYFPDCITQICLDSNGLKDVELAELSKGFQNLKSFKCVVIKRNEVGPKTIEQLNDLLEREFPQNVEELRLISAKMSSFLSTKILHQLTVRCHLRKLSLVECSLGDFDADNICKIINNSRFLIDLDISWNMLNNTSMLKICEAVSQNRHLQHLNISWNFLTKRVNNKFDDLIYDEAQAAYITRTKLISMKFIENLDSTYFHKNQELELKIHEYLLNKDPKFSQEEYIAAIMAAD